MTLASSNATPPTRRHLEQLLQDVAVKVGSLREARMHFSDQLAPDFSVFDYLRSDEVGLSRCLAGLLDPTGTHGQGPLFLRRFLETIDRPGWWVDGERWKVALEQQVAGQRRIDIYLSSPTAVIGIENKPWAADQDGQLRAYAKHLEDDAGGRPWALVYLCDADPSEASLSKAESARLASDGRFVHIDFERVAQWLEQSLASVRALNVRVFVEELARFIRRGIRGELDMTEKLLTAEVVTGNAHQLAAAFEIANALPEVKARLLRSFEQRLRDVLAQDGIALSVQPGLERGEKWTTMSVEFVPGQDIMLKFGFEAPQHNGFIWGMSRRDDRIAKDPARWQIVRDVMTKACGVGQSSDHWMWHRRSATDLFGDDFANWNLNPAPWLLLREDARGPSGQSPEQRIAEVARNVRETLTRSNRLGVLFGGSPTLA